MTQLTVDDYTKCVRASGLVNEDLLSGAIKGLAQKFPNRPLDSRLVSQHLLDNKLITPWHQSKLVKGCSKGFFIGRYKLLAHLGTGGMSRVYVAVHTMMKRQVAIKVLNQKLTQSESHLQRFLRESQAAAALDHPNVVRAYDVDCDRDLYYFVMEYVEGPTLQQLVEKRGPLAADFAAEYTRQAALGLQHAHDHRLVHRDVKPGNLLVNNQGVVKVLDLGMVRLSSEEVKSITIQFNESMLGTADYLAPEQALDCHNVDHRADIYSLGCTLYFLLAGRPPFADGSMAMRLMRHQSEAPPKIPRDDIPQELLDVCWKMMGKTPDDRYPSMQAAADALQEFLTKRRPAGKPFPPLPPLPGDGGTGDTVTETGGPTTVFNDAAGGGASSISTPGGSIRPGPGPAPQPAPAPVAAAAPAQPAAAAPKPAAPAAGATPRPADIAQWRQQDYVTALLENDAQFINAVRSLLHKFNSPDKVEKVVVFLENLLKSPNLGKVQVNAQALGVLLLGLSSTQSKNATRILQKVVVNAMGMGVNDATGLRLAVAALGECPSPEKDKFLVELLANSEEARPTGRSEVTPTMLRQVVARVIQSKLPTNPRLKAELAARVEGGKLNPEAAKFAQKLLGA